jgi:DNA invertase Pin-like site-specific DNA recombinase
MGTPAQANLTLVAGAATTAAPRPAEPVPVALLARTSTLGLQDPLASLNRQIRSCQAWLPAGWYIAGYYWDIESGGLDLENRSQTDSWQQFTAAGIPRDGGMADLLTEAKAPLPRFAAVICEDIERSARDTFNALKLEKKLAREGIPLFATDEPASVEGINSTTVLVRRVKQGVAEWFRLQLKEKAWNGLQEHSLAGWNIGSPPYGYLADRVPHPAPAKAAQGRTKSRLILDPDRSPAVDRIFHWRVTLKLSIRTITDRLNDDPAAYPAPAGTPGWTKTSVTKILANPKYTGHMVYGRTRKHNGTKRPVPQDQWIWTPEPVHPAIIDRATWDAAQKTGAQRGNIRDPETPATRTGRRYILRSRVRHRDCQRRMCGTWRSSATGTVYIYYRCPHDPANPRHAAAHPDHGPVSVREDALMDALAQFFDQYVFGHDRAALLTTQLPATTAGHAKARARTEKHLRTALARIDTAERALISELEQLGPDTSPAAQAYRHRIRARNAELYDERTQTETTLADLQASAPPDNDPDLLGRLPHATAAFAAAPDRIKEALLAAFDIQALYSKDTDQVTIWATLTEDTPRTIAALINDPRTDNDTGTPTPGQDPFCHSGPAPIGVAKIHDLGPVVEDPATRHYSRIVASMVKRRRVFHAWHPAPGFQPASTPQAWSPHLPHPAEEARTRRHARR